ncbi:MAG TPA: hypothetical protein VME42_02655 [Steroidobacteraceae bacterium]|nr:hypothetical protein [Steroidobacteraceae bacterium]
MIERAESIEIEHCNGDCAAGPLAVGEQFRESVLEFLPIRQAGERIVSGEILQTRMRFFEVARAAFGALLESIATHRDHQCDGQHGAADGGDADRQQVRGHLLPATRREYQVPVSQHARIRRQNGDRGGNCRNGTYCSRVPGPVVAAFEPEPEGSKECEERPEEGRACPGKPIVQRELLERVAQCGAVSRTHTERKGERAARYFGRVRFAACDEQERANLARNCNRERYDEPEDAYARSLGWPKREHLDEVRRPQAETQSDRGEQHDAPAPARRDPGNPDGDREDRTCLEHGHESRERKCRRVGCKGSHRSSLKASEARQGSARRSEGISRLVGMGGGETL